MDQILNLIGNYGYLAIFMLLLMGIFGVPVPDESLLMFSGFLISLGDLKMHYTIPAAALGSMCGISISFLVGRFGGFFLIQKYGPRIHITKENLEKARAWFDRRGKWTLLFGYFLPGIRHLTAIIAGSTGMRYRTFGLFAYSGAVIWVTIFILIGFSLGEKWQPIAREIQVHLLPASIIIAAAIVVIIILVRLFRGGKAMGP
jgi:membrane protein DedA with SNARE-associated domain